MTIKETGSAVRRLTKTMLLLTAALLVDGILALAPQGEAKAADATEIEVNTKVSNYLASEYDEHYYTFTVPSDGYFNITVSAEDDVYLYLYDSNGTQRYYDRGDDTFTTKTLPTSAGNSYSIKIEPCAGIVSVWGWDASYTMQINFTAADDWESDNNDTAATADDLALNSTIHGSSFNSSDNDWYRVTLSERGTVSFSLQHDAIGQSDDWNFKLLDENGNTLYSKSYTSGFSSCELGYRKGTVLYIVISPDDSDVVDQPYSLTCSFTKPKKYEMEDNGTQARANSITVGKKYSAIMNGSDDYDWYKVKMDETGYLKLKFGPVDISNTGTWQIYLYDKNGNSTQLYRASTTQTVKAYVKKGTYYIRVSSYSGAGWVPYTFKVTETAKSLAGTPVISNCSKSYTYSWSTSSLTVNNVTLSKKIPLADGFEVTVASDKAMENVLLTKNCSVNKKTISVGSSFYLPSSNTQYIYVRVRPYVTDAFGNKIYGTKSAVYTKKI